MDLYLVHLLESLRQSSVDPADSVTVELTQRDATIFLIGLTLIGEMETFMELYGVDILNLTGRLTDAVREQKGV